MLHCPNVFSLNKLRSVTFLTARNFSKECVTAQTGHVTYLFAKYKDFRKIFIKIFAAILVEAMNLNRFRFVGCKGQIWVYQFKRFLKRSDITYGI